MQKRHLFFSLFLFAVTAASAQQPRPDTARRGPGLPGGNGSGPKPYKEVITSKALSDGGLFWVHKIDEKYFFEIPDSVLNREILVVNRISKAPAGLRNGLGFFGYAGDQIGSNVIRFEKGPNNKVFIRNILHHPIKAKIGRNAVILTKFGAQFCAACVAESTHSR